MQEKNILKNIMREKILVINKNMKGCYNQGVLLSFGKEVKQNHFEATKLYKKACDFEI